ncbi:alpha/beta hydrolase [Crateriforma conspicua]|nr:prolyl oligopeptidase family serine peptidase [Crateriforma conspicua]
MSGNLIHLASASLGFPRGRHRVSSPRQLMVSELTKQWKMLTKPLAPPTSHLVIYPGGLADAKTGTLKSHLSVNNETPPMFFVHAADDHASCLNSSALFTALQLAGVPAELHILESGGHGYGLRRKEQPVTHWPDLAEAWLRRYKLVD